MIEPMFDEVERWRERMVATPLEVQTGSLLADDDAATGCFQTSHAALGALHTATDHLHSLRTLVRDAGWLHTYAPFTLCRTALECAATAVWLLAPEARQERIIRQPRQRRPL